MLNFDRSKGDKATNGSIQEGDKQDGASPIGNEHFSPSSIEDNSTEDNLGDALDQMLNSSSSLSPLNGMTQGDEQDENNLVDYNEDDDLDDIIRNEDDKTKRAKIFADNHTEVEAHNNTVAEDEDKLGDEDFAQGESRERTHEEKPKGKDREVEAQEGALQLAEINVNTPVAKPMGTWTVWTVAEVVTHPSDILSGGEVFRSGC